MSSKTWVLACVWSCAALACDWDYTRCEAPDPARLAQLPLWLSETGLYADSASEAPAPGVERFRPLEELWSDGASKQRFVWLPPGSMIDTRDMDSWQFPEGTKLWKTFEQGGVKLETRLLLKLDTGWAAAAYVYREDSADAQLTEAGAENVLGTEHDVPAARQCPGCHGGRESFALGFSAIQLGATLSQLVAAGKLSHPPAREPRIPGSAREREALSYLHANCGHCHNSARPASGEERCFDPENDLDFWLRVDRPRVDMDGKENNMLRRMSRRGAGQMPPLGTERVDERAVTLLRSFLEDM